MKKTISILLILVLMALMLPLRLFAVASPQDTETYKNLYASVQGETNANAAYIAFAAQAEEEGYPEISRLFLATADAEAKHAGDEWDILVAMGATVRPVAAAPAVGTTAENLQAAFDGETYEYTVMYPGFLATAIAEGMDASTFNARSIFNLAGRAEQVHAGNYADALANLDDPAYLKETFGVLYRCPVCGEVVTSRPGRCPICGTDGASFVMYNATYFNLYASVQGETNANAAYIAFSAKAKEEGYPEISLLFLATADAEAKHANDEWAILVTMGATVRPVAAVPTVGTTAENLQAAFDGETYEYTVMYPGFLATANAEGMNADAFNAGRIFNLARMAEQVHAGNYDVALLNLDNPAYLKATFGVLYRCPVCGEVVTSRPAGRCPICGADGSSFIEYSDTKLEKASASASVEKLSGNQNRLTITVTEYYTHGTIKDITAIIMISNNAADKYAVGSYTVYVDTKGNVQVRECYIV